MNLAEGVRIVSFALLTIMTIGSALGVVLFANIVYSAFLLGAVFVSIAGMFLLLNADFVAAAQVLIYVGSVNVLILFAIMLVNKREDFKPLPGAWIRKAATGLVCFGLFALLGTIAISTSWDIGTTPPIANSIEAIGQHFFTDFLLPFELASVLLLIAMIGAIVLARREFLPEEKAIDLPQPPVLTLPERPREAISSIGGEEK